MRWSGGTMIRAVCALVEQRLQQYVPDSRIFYKQHCTRSRFLNSTLNRCPSIDLNTHCRYEKNGKVTFPGRSNLTQQGAKHRNGPSRPEVATKVVLEIRNETASKTLQQQVTVRRKCTTEVVFELLNEVASKTLQQQVTFRRLCKTIFDISVGVSSIKTKRQRGGGMKPYQLPDAPASSASSSPRLPPRLDIASTSLDGLRSSFSSSTSRS